MITVLNAPLKLTPEQWGLGPTDEFYSLNHQAERNSPHREHSLLTRSSCMEPLHSSKQSPHGTAVHQPGRHRSFSTVSGTNAFRGISQRATRSLPIGPALMCC